MVPTLVELMESHLGLTIRSLPFHNFGRHRVPIPHANAAPLPCLENKTVAPAGRARTRFRDCVTP